MEILYGKQKIKDYMLSQINELFMTNYQGYHYKELTSLEGINELLSKKEFDCVCVVEVDKVVGFAGIYETTDTNDLVAECKLAHLLVDTSLRGKGIGTVLEEGRLHLIKQGTAKKTIYASCVEKPKKSMYMKLKRNFFVNGFRYKYRSTTQLKENAVILVNTSFADVGNTIRINVRNKMTRVLLKRGNPNVIFSSDVEFENCYSLDIYKDEKLARIIGRLCYNQHSGIRLSDISLPKSTYGEYVSVFVSPSIIGYDMIDSYLLMNKFYPVCYIPYVKDYYGMVEYQYLPNGLCEIIQDKNVSNEGKNFIMDLCN